MSTINNVRNNDYSVFHVKVNNGRAPWIEIQKKSENPMTFIVINPLKGHSLFKDKKNSHMKYGEYNMNIYETYINTNENIDNDDDDNDIYTYAVNANICCLKKSSKLNVVPFSVFTALTSILNNNANGLFDINRSNIKPCIIINTFSDYCVAPKNGITKMINEVTAAYVNHYKEYPTIFVTYQENDKLISEYTYKGWNK